MIADMLMSVTRFLVGGHARWTGCAPDGRQRIYFANHGSHLDTLILCAALPRPLRAATHPVAALDYWGGSALRRFIAVRLLNAVLVDRDGGRNPLGPLLDTLGSGGSLIIFPEGSRHDGALPKPFKSGLYHLARRRPDLELIPVYLTNLARAYPRGAILPAPISCSVGFGTPIALAPSETKADFLNRAHRAVCALATGDVA